MKDISTSLDDIALFVAIADCGGLAPAARLTGTPPPTLSRRMATLERQLERRLFVRGARGYSLTAEGRALLAEASDIRGLSQRLARWRDRDRPAPVRISAGPMTAAYLVRNISRWWAEGARWRPEFAATTAAVDIARREADIGIRNRRPDQPWLAAMRTAGVAYAAYAASPEVTGWIAPPEDAAAPASGRWVRRNHAGEIATTADSAFLAIELARTGIGRVVLPTFAGAASGLEQVGPEIAELAHDEWLVSHHDGRNDPPVRAALDAIAAALADPLRPGRTPGG